MEQKSNACPVAKKCGGCRYQGVEYPATVLCDLLHLEGAEALATYQKDFYADMPAVTRNTFGKGATYYVGTQMDDAGLAKILDQAVNEVEGIQRIRLGSLEPGIVTEEFAKELSSMPKVCPHFHLSLQSGCDTTLERMNRRYRNVIG